MNRPVDPETRKAMRAKAMNEFNEMAFRSPHLFLPLSTRTIAGFVGDFYRADLERELGIPNIRLQREKGGAQ